LEFGGSAKLAYPERKNIRDNDIHSRDGYEYYTNFILEMNKSAQIFAKKTVLQWQVGRITLWL